MSFHNIATQIIRESINSAVYIDDKIVLPFEQNIDGLLSPSELYSSFRNNDCSLDFFRYDGEPVEQKSKFLFYNRDLLILDWHLLADESDLNPTFEVLKNAIGAQNLHFCVIYTTEKTTLLPEKVIYNIASFFSGLTKQLSENGAIKFEELLNDKGLSQQDINDVEEDFKRLTKELFFEFKNKEKNKEFSKALNALVDKFSSKKEFEEFLRSLKLPFADYKELLVCLGFILNKGFVPEQETVLPITVSKGDRYTIRVDSLFIKVVSKEITNSHLYEEFKRSLVNESNIFLTLLGLEMRNRFRENSAFIGKEMDGVDYLAFFFHRKNHYDGQEQLFNEFLKDMWKDQVASFLLEKDILLFQTIEEYKAAANVDSGLAQFNKSTEDCRNAIAQLNWVYNRLAVNRKEDDEIRFGDIFFFNEEGKNIYLLCLTPHCDCLRPGKIKNMYFFVEGKDIGISSGVEKNDGDYISYIKKTDGSLTCIDWTNATDDCKPFTIYIANHKMQGADRLLKASLLGKEQSLTYLCTLKENYAQRVANKAFFYPLRVGIDFASFKTH